MRENIIVTAYEFIFSGKRKHRLTRHLTFWGVFCLQMLAVNARPKTASYLFIYQSYQSSFFLLLAILPVCIFSVYIFLYLLFSLLQEKRYTLFTVCFVGMIIVNCVFSLFLYILARPYTCSDCDAITLREAINIAGANGINTACFLGIVGLGIKFTKNWYLQQIRNRILARQKITNELKLLKARIQPDFLFESLQALYHKISSDKNEAAQMLLKFSDLLSYMLYECNDDFVLMEGELAITNEFIALENMMKKRKIRVSNYVTGDISQKYIPSFILLPLIQNCVTAFHDIKLEKYDAEIEIYVENNIINCSVHVQTPTTEANKDIYVSIVNTFINRLEMFYKNNYTLELSGKEGRLIIIMSLLLADNFSPNTIKETSKTGYAYEHV